MQGWPLQISPSSLLCVLIFLPFTLGEMNDFSSNRVAMVTMTRKPTNLDSWVAHQFDRLDISHLYLYFDYTPHLVNYFTNQVERIDLRYREKMTIIEMTEEWRQNQNYISGITRDRSEENRYRQTLIVQHAINQALDINLDWIFHIDTDELIHLWHNETLPLFLSMINYHDPKHMNQTFAFRNWEVAVEHGHYENCFLEGKWFRTQTRGFIAYGNGKGFGRLSPYLRPWGVHRFRSSILPRDVHIPATEMVLLHYPCCNVDQFVTKYRNLGKFDDQGWEWAWFHREARDRMAACREGLKPPSLSDPPLECEERVAELMLSKRVPTNSSTPLVYIEYP